MVTGLDSTILGTMLLCEICSRMKSWCFVVNSKSWFVDLGGGFDECIVIVITAREEQGYRLMPVL
jgi:hypothetical protein